MIYPTITVWQPWATLIAEECKPWEFRGWTAPARLHGKRIAIHSAARKINLVEVRALLVKLHSATWRETGLLRDQSILLLERVKSHTADFPTSSVVCTAELGLPIQKAELAERLGLTNDSDRDEHSNWGWPLSKVERVIPPMPATGQQGWWRWSDPR